MFLSALLLFLSVYLAMRFMRSESKRRTYFLIGSFMAFIWAINVPCENTGYNYIIHELQQNR
jgi:hypothetical protein